MKHGIITKNITWMRYGVYLVIGIVILAGTSGGYKPDLWIELVIFAALFVLLTTRTIVNKRRLSQRNKQIKQMVAKHPEYSEIPDGGNASWFVEQLGAIDELHGARDPKITNVVGTPDWTYGDFTYNLYGRLKNSEYVKAKVYYGVMTTQLPRELPNVFFDSIKARHRQFRLHFARDQRHSLEGDFDKYFVTYFPAGYTIDSMSFISPEVMWALRAAKDYDIEIYGNRLFLYGPLFDPGQQLPDMSAKILEIKKQLADNVTTYRDARLPFAEGRKRVAAQAVNLKISKFWTIVSTAILIGYVLLQIFAHR